MKKQSKPGDLFNAHKAMAMKKKKPVKKHKKVAKKHKQTMIGSPTPLPKGYKAPKDDYREQGAAAAKQQAANPFNKGSLKMTQPSYLRGRNVKPLTTVGGKAVGAGYKFKKNCRMKHKHVKHCR